ncbi:MAG: F0F1 ATP synthase subunit delta [Cyanobacteria bacterium REEB459]|nr:F0F1 ATP synthase subunit delta [Cyanobacteria bacterium REEB459]
MKDTAMTNSVTVPYAQALIEVAQADQVVDQIGAEVGELLTALEGSEDLRAFLANPLLDPEAKKSVLRQVVGEQANPTLLNFLMVLVDRNRIVFLDSVLRQYQTLLRQLDQTVLADVITAIELSEQQRSQIKDQVITLTGARQVELSVEIDPSLLGGLIIKVGSQIIDASLRTQLRRIGMQLASVA